MIAHRSGKMYEDNCYGYPFRQNNGGRSESRKKYVGDCGAIALAIVSGKSYDDCVAALKDGALFSNSGCFFNCFVHSLDWEDKTFDGLSFQWMSFPAVKGEIRMRAKEFCEKFPRGNFVIRVSRHYLACIDGVMQGEYPIEADRCIYGAWRVVRAIEKQEAA